jgi:hypothetical protein
LIGLASVKLFIVAESIIKSAIFFLEISVISTVIASIITKITIITKAIKFFLAVKFSFAFIRAESVIGFFKPAAGFIAASVISIIPVIFIISAVTAAASVSPSVVFAVAAAVITASVIVHKKFIPQISCYYLILPS